MCVKKGQYQSGDPVVYFEQGTALPRETAEMIAFKNAEKLFGRKVSLDLIGKR